MAELYNIVSDEELTGLNACTGTKNCDEGNYDKLNNIISQIQTGKQREQNNQRRLVQLNSYYGKKTSAQTKILKTIFIMVVLVIGLLFLRAYVDIIPDWLITGAISIVIGTFIINILYQSADISNRNNMDYDLYDTNLTKFPPLAKENDASEKGSMSLNTATQSIYGSKGHCMDSQCCPKFYTFNPTLGYCSLNPFT